MKHIIKKITAAAMAISLLGTGTIVKDNSNYSVTNKQILEADASSIPEYVKYDDINQYIDIVLKKQKGVRCMTYYCPTYYFLDFKYGRACRGVYDIPGDENNCTVICVLNCLVYALKSKGYTVNDALYRYYYQELIKMATEQFSYNPKKGGLPLVNHKNFYIAVLKRFGHYEYTTPDVKTFSLPQELVSISNTPNKPFILSSTAKSHSMLVHSKVTWHLEYIDKNGRKKSEDVDFFECFDPNGDNKLVPVGNIVDLIGFDWEQVMYCAN